MPTALIVGASRGIGLELARQYRADGWRVLATARDATGLERLAALGAEAFALDVADATSVSGLQWRLDGVKLDVAFVVAGVFGSRTRGLEPPSQDEFDLVMRTNVLGPMRVLPQLMGSLSAGSRLAVLSSRMGSVGGREGHYAWLYRASKAAVNSVLKDASLAAPAGAICVAFHPGWVQTDMGGAGADLTVEKSASDMRRTLAGLGPADNGRFVNHDGSAIPW